MDIKKKKEKKPSGKNISSVVQLKNGSFSLVVTAIVLAIIVVVNLIIGQLPSKLLNWDLSETGIFSVSDTSKELLKDLDKDCLLYTSFELDYDQTVSHKGCKTASRGAALLSGISLSKGASGADITYFSKHQLFSRIDSALLCEFN